MGDTVVGLFLNFAVFWLLLRISLSITSSPKPAVCEISGTSTGFYPQQRLTAPAPPRRGF